MIGSGYKNNSIISKESFMDEKQQYAIEYVHQILMGLEELAMGRNKSMIPDVWHHANDNIKKYHDIRTELDRHDILPPATLTNLRHAVWTFPEQNWKDALSKFQIMSKRWLVHELAEHVGFVFDQVYVLGGWLGVLPFLLFSEGFQINQLFNFDTDESVLEPSRYVNHEYETQRPGTYFARSMDAYKLNYEDDKIIVNHHVPNGDTIDGNPDLIINTICEHMADYGKWITRVPIGKNVVLQSNNMFGIDDHVNCCSSLDEFVAECQLSEIKFASALDFGDTWQRFMIIGKR
jgi:hypothetical protein